MLIEEQQQESIEIEQTLEKLQKPELSIIEQGELLCFLRDRGVTIKDIRNRIGLNDQVITLRTRVYKGLTPEEREKVHIGVLTQDEAMILVKHRLYGEDPIKRVRRSAGRRRVPGFKVFQEWYRDDKSLSEEIRKFIADKILRLEYMPSGDNLETWKYIADTYLVDKNIVVGHFGCGDKAVLGDYLIDNTVYTFNQTDVDDAITCDLGKIPFHNEELDAAAFTSPSNNNKANFREAFRLLKFSGQIYVAERRRRAKRVAKYLHKVGFKVVKMDEFKDIVFFVAKK